MPLPHFFSISTLEQEQRITSWVSYLLPGLVVSGYVTLVWPSSEPMLIQALFLLHTLVGLVIAPLAVIYLVVHFIRTLGNRSFSVFFSGILAAVLVAAVTGSGLWLVWPGQTQSTRWVLDVHIYGSMLLVMVAAGHIVYHLRNRRGRRRRGPVWPSLTRIRRNPFILHTGGQLLLVALVVPLYGSSSDESYQSIPDNYSKTYGEHPLRPSETEILGGPLVTTEAIADSDECTACHEDIARQWRSSAHRKAALDPAYERNVILLAEKKGIEATRYCEGCHAPIALLTGELTPGGKHGGIDGTPANHEGVSCKSCHAVREVIHTKGVGSYAYQPAKPYLFANTDNPLGQALNHLLIRARPELHRKKFRFEACIQPGVLRDLSCSIHGQGNE